MLGILIAIVLMSFIYPMFSKFDFNDVSKVNDFSLRYVHPNAQYWFGTDSNGKSLFDSVWFGARNSILIAVIATFLNVVIGLLVGAVWGISKTFDMIMMEIYNIISNIPALLVVIVLTYSLGAGFLEYDLCHDCHRLDWYLLILSVFKSCVTVTWSTTWLLVLWEHQLLRLWLKISCHNLYQLS